MTAADGWDSRSAQASEFVGSILNFAFIIAFETVRNVFGFTKILSLVLHGRVFFSYLIHT